MSKTLHAGNKGMANLGNTCYMNSALQCLSHLLTFHPLNEMFQAHCVSASEDCLLKEWYAFQREIWSNERQQMINPISLLQCFQKQCHLKDYYFENFQQNDAHEFLCLFLDLLHQGNQRPVKIKSQNRCNTNDEYDELVRKSEETWARFYSNDYSYIVENFSSQLLEITRCPLCEYYTSNHDPIQVISLWIPKSAKSLRDCLESYTQSGTLDEQNQWKCDNCHEHVTPKKQTILWKTSDILIILLKRYTPNRKITRHLDYSEQLDLQGLSFNFNRKQENKYALQGFCVHGGSLGGGHYFAVCKNHLDKQWYEYNDTNVSKIPEDHVTTYRPYIFFYKRV